MKAKFLVIAFVLFGLQGMAQITCTVKVKLVNRPESKLVHLSKIYEDLRVKSRQIEISDSVFEFKISESDPEIYELVFEEELSKGSWHSISFCTYDGVISMEIHPAEERKKNKIIGGDENIKMQESRLYQGSLFETMIYPVYAKRDSIPYEDQLSNVGKELDRKIATASKETRDKVYKEWDAKLKSGEIYTPEIRSINAEIDSALTAKERLLGVYEQENPSIGYYGSLISDMTTYKSFSELFSDFYKKEGSPLENIENRYNKYSKLYPQHPYTSLGRELLDNIKGIRVGGKYVDFTAPDLDGNMVSLSSQIDGKIALIDLWASWCGPCRRGSISFIPIYEQYKDSGFTIVGVAREYDNDSAMRTAIMKDGYQWLNLIEINDRAAIWQTYGIGYSGGGVVMVDRDGTILAISPDATEVKRILAEKIPAN